jgi:hypothetical protein
MQAIVGTVVGAEIKILLHFGCESVNADSAGRKVIKCWRLSKPSRLFVRAGRRKFHEPLSDKANVHSRNQFP